MFPIILCAGNSLSGAPWAKIREGAAASSKPAIHVRTCIICPPKKWLGRIRALNPIPYAAKSNRTVDHFKNRAIDPQWILLGDYPSTIFPAGIQIRGDLYEQDGDVGPASVSDRIWFRKE